MADNPVIGFSLGEPSCPVTPDSDLWKAALPTARTSGPGDSGDVTVGDYFQAAERFLKDHDFQVIKTAAVYLGGLSADPDDIRDINVCLVKHGRFYHPSKVSVRFEDDRSLVLALNLAFSPEGNDTASRECAALNALKGRVGDVPVVFGIKKREQVGRHLHSAFCVQWFEGFHEFHLTTDPEGLQRTVLWDTDFGHRYLTGDEVSLVYRRVARILTDSYNLFTCEQIQPWHHAAGDFVARTGEGTTDVRLITVRQYTSLFQECFEEPEDLAEAALIFLAGMAIRTRLDRADGVGEILWAGPSAIPATFQGFFESLADKAKESRAAETLVDMIRSMAGRMTEDDLLNYSRMIIASYNPQSPESPLIQRQLETHARECHQALGSLI